LSSPITIFYFAAALLAGLTIHEASHAFIADRLGDPTARSLGRITLNPIAHLDPAGTLMMIFASIFGIGIGWGKPVPVNPSNLRPDPKTGYALVAAAGPVSNLLLAALLALVLQLGLGLPAILENVLFYTIFVSVSLAIFNLIPLPPLDGFSVLLGILPNTAARPLSRLYQWGPGLLLLLVFLGGGLVSQYLAFFSRPILRALGVA
jgi:Zn-dependent protease